MSNSINAPHNKSYRVFKNKAEKVAYILGWEKGKVLAAKMVRDVKPEIKKKKLKEEKGIELEN